MSTFKKYKDKLRNSKGITTLELAISALIVIMALTGFIDMVKVSQKLDTASSVTGYVGRVVANQGGVRTSPTAHHTGTYVTSAQMYREVQTILGNAGITDKDFTLLVNNQKITSSTNVPLQTFGNRMKVELKVAYEWELMSQVVPGTLKSQQSSSREVVSSFKVRNGNIKTEYSGGE